MIAARVFSVLLFLTGFGCLSQAQFNGCGAGFCAGATAVTHPLDGFTTTGAWSFSRSLYSSYTSALYSDTGGLVDVLNDQSGNSRNFTSSTTLRPTITSAGPNNRVSAVFDGSTDGMTTSVALSNFIAAGAGYMVITFLADDITLNAANRYNNHCLIGDLGAFAGLFLTKNGSSPHKFTAYNWDGNADYAEQDAVVISTAYVVEWRHEGGNIYQRVNVAGETSVASGNTSSLTSSLELGYRLAGTAHYKGKSFEAVTFSTVPGATDRGTIATDMGRWVGAL